MVHTYTIEGIVIKRTNFGECDKLLTIFTKKQGKILLLAKGIRKINSKKSPHLELFNIIQGFVAKGKTFDIITEATSTQVFSKLSSHLNNLAYAYKMSEEIDSLCPEREINSGIFLLIIKVLSTLNDSSPENLDMILNTFTHHLLWNLGFLQREKLLDSLEIDVYVKQIIERNLKSNMLIEKVS